MANEKRLIDGWDLIEWLDDFDRENTLRILRGKKAKLLNSHAIRNMIDTVPRVDAVEVVRCKNCHFLGWRGTNTNDCGYFYCKHPSGLRVIKNAHTSYCDYGERKDND